MSHRFLCACHRQLILADNTTAEKYQLQWTQKGLLLKEQARYQDCIAYLGCAFEVADYLLNTAQGRGTSGLRQFTNSATLLASAYALVGDAEAAEQLLRYSQSRVAEQRASNEPETQYESDNHANDWALTLH